MSSETNPWNCILAALKSTVDPMTYQTWLKPTRFDHNGDHRLFVRVPNQGFADYIAERFKDQIEKKWMGEYHLAGPGVTELCFTIDDPDPEPQKIKSTSEEKDEDEVPIPSTAPVIPDECWGGIFSEFRDIASKAGEAPDSFLFGGISTALAAGLGKSVWLRRPVEVYPSMFICLVGPTNCGKSDTHKMAIEKVLKKAVPDLLYLNNFASSQGLFRAILDNRGRSPSVVMCLSELRSLIKVSAQKSSGDLLEKLNDLYDCVPELQHNTKERDVIQNPPPGVFIAATTPEWMRNLKEDDILGGLGRRVVFFAGEPPADRWPDAQDFSPVSERLKDILEFWKSRGSTELSWEPEALEAYKKWHKTMPSVSCKNTLIRAMSSGHRSYVLKFCILFAASEKCTAITLRHVKKAICLTDGYFFNCLWMLFSDFNLSPIGRIEEKMLVVVKGSPNKTISRRSLIKRFHSHGDYDRWMVRRALENIAGKYADDDSWDEDLRLITIGRKPYVTLND